MTRQMVAGQGGQPRVEGAHRLPTAWVERTGPDLRVQFFLQ